jgi:hypothetical protein
LTPASARLRTDRYVFAGRHRKCAGYQACDTGEQDIFSICACGRDSYDEDGRGDDAIVCSKNGSAQPSDAFRSVYFTMSHDWASVGVGHISRIATFQMSSNVSLLNRTSSRNH